MASVELFNITKQFADGTTALSDVSLVVENRELLVLVGPSGCGKSTLLRVIAGLEQPTSGTVRIGDTIVNEIPPARRNIAMVFQNYALYPHMTVYRNIAFGLRMRNRRGWPVSGFGQHRTGDSLESESDDSAGDQQVGRLAESRSPGRRQLKQDNDKRVRQTAERLGIEHLLDRRPHQLSGGERQRVALGRAIVREPAAFLFDEPLSNLDARLRVEMRTELLRLHRELDATMIYVTHDQVEAMTLGDRIAVMDRGLLLQVGSPQQVYRQPANRFVSEFTGWLPINLIDGDLQTGDRAGEQLVFCAPGLRADVTHLAGQWPEVKRDELPRRVTLAIRPDEAEFEGVGTELRMDAKGGELGRSAVAGAAGVGFVTEIPVCVEQVQWLGDGSLVEVSLRGNNSKAGSNQAARMTIRAPREVRPAEGERMTIGIDVRRCHWFDAETGNNLEMLESDKT